MKKIPIIIIVALMVILLSVGGYYFWKNKSAKTTGPVGEQPSPTPIPKDLVKWEDPAGFVFQYPKGIEINKHDEDMENYAHLEFSQNTHPGSLFVWAKDISDADVSSWIKNDKNFSKANSIDTTLGGLEAKKIIITDPVKKMVTGAIADQILFTVESTSSGDPFWQDVYDTVVSTFSFTDEAGNIIGTTGDEQAGEDSYEVAVDEEETIE